METNISRFEKIDLKGYEGLCIGVVNGKILFKNKDPAVVLKRLLSRKKDEEVSCICVPSIKTAMAL